MRFANKILQIDWLSDFREKDKNENTGKTKNSKSFDVSVSHFKDNGGIYLLCLDWNIEEVEEWIQKGGFIDEWERRMEDTGLCIMSGSMDGDIDVVHTSCSEIFMHEE